MDIYAMLGRVPDFKEFYGVDELYGHAVRVASANPGLCRLEYVGQSKAGEPIPMVSVGDGPQSVLLFASPHPNEPIGAMMAYFLLDELIADPGLRDGRTWHIIPCIDPVGTRLNEGWFKGPFNIRNYARHFYRPKGEDQAEWSFPIEYKTLKFDRPIPETRALMNAITKTRPAVMYSLHNSGFGGAYYYLSRPLEKAYPAFHSIPKSVNLPLSLGEPEMPFMKVFAPAVFEMPRVTDAYDHYAKYTDQDPARFITGGGSSRDFAEGVSKPLILVTEVPYFMSPKIADLTKVGRPRKELVLEGVAKARKMLDFVTKLIDYTKDEVTEEPILKDASIQFAVNMGKRLDGHEKWANEAPELLEEGTVAQEADNLHVGVFQNMTIFSMYRRALAAQVAKGASRKVEEAYEDLDRAIEGWATEVEEALDYSVVPIRDLVQVQYGALLAVLEALA